MNSKPYFVTEFGLLEYRQNSGRVVIPLPEIVDPNGDDTLVEVDNLLTEFLEWTPIANELVFIIDDYILPGSYDFMIILSDPEESSLYPITVYILPNSEPYFKEQLRYPVYKLGSGINFYPLPDTIDEDGDIVTIDILEQEAITATYSESPISGITFIIDDSIEPGTYYIPLILNDGYETATYILEVKLIRNTKPYYKKTLGPLNYRNTGT